MRALVLIISVLFAPLLSLAEPAWTLDNNCLATLTHGKYQGQCMDTSLKRAVKVISQDEHQITIENFRKAGRFYRVSIPLAEVQSLSYVIVDLNTRPLNVWGLINVSHTQLRFQMRKGSSLQLTAQDGSAFETATENDLMVSFNYMAPKGVGYDPIAGLNASLYGSVLQVFSTGDEVQSRYVTGTPKRNMYEIRLNVAEGPAGTVLKEFLVQSEQRQYATAYDTWNSNCTTVLFDILDKALGLTKAKPYRFQTLNAYDTGMIPPFLALADRGLIEKKTRIKLMNYEFGYDLFPSWSNSYYFDKWVDRDLDEVRWSLWRPL